MMQSVSVACILLALILNVLGDRIFKAAPKHSSLKRSTLGIQPSLDYQKLVYHSSMEIVFD